MEKEKSGKKLWAKTLYTYNKKKHKYCYWKAQSSKLDHKNECT